MALPYSGYFYCEWEDMVLEDDCNLRLCQGIEDQVGDIPCAL